MMTMQMNKNCDHFKSLVAWGIFGNLRVRATVGLIWCLVIIGVGHQWRKCSGHSGEKVHGPQVLIIAQEGASSSLECGPSILPQRPKLNPLGQT